jgi:HAE1 family hydrophobic/amphiphilic exporter-1
MPRNEAILTANHVRLRPILMTTIAIVAGMLPIAFGKGAGSGSRASMAVTIIGGQAICLLLTLLVTPVIYSLFDDAKQFFQRKHGAEIQEEAPAALPAEENAG